MRYLFTIALPIVLVSLLACKNTKKNLNDKKEKPSVAIDVVVASLQKFPSEIEVNGTVLAEEMVELHPEMSGRLTYLNIPDGSTVPVGTLLAKINDADLQAQLQQQKVQLDLAKKTEQRLSKLLTINGVDQATYDAALSQVNLYEANMNVLNAQIAKTVVKAPFSGKLGLRLVSLGAYVSPTTAIGTLQETNRIKIDFAVPETYEKQVKIGKTVLIKSSSSDESYMATISAVEPQIDASTRNIKVRARLTKGIISPGAFVKVILGETKTGIMIPTNAIIPDALSSQVILVKNNRAVFQNVETGSRNADGVEITSGLNPGDSVVVDGMLYARPNSLLKVKKSRTGK